MKSSIIYAAAFIGAAFAIPTSRGSLATRIAPPANTKDIESRGKRSILQSHAGGVQKRQSGVANLARAIYDLVTHDVNAWDPNIPNSCVINMSTQDGGNCYASVSCGEGDIGNGWNTPPALSPAPFEWNVCYLNGVQYFNHPLIGDFSIQFTAAGGVDGNTQDGLHNPILKLAQIGDWEAIDVQTLSETYATNGGSGNICSPNNDFDTLGWVCGVPQIGYSDFGFTNTPLIGSGYTAGWCGIHFVEYRSSDDSQYSLAARVVDAAGNLLAQVGDSYSTDGTNTVPASPAPGIDSALPYVVVITPPNAPNSDDVPIQFAYSNQSFDSSSPQCGTGAWDSSTNTRQGDCGFTC